MIIARSFTALLVLVSAATSAAQPRAPAQIVGEFCAGCPDPAKARWLVVECLDPMTDEQLVDVFRDGDPEDARSEQAQQQKHGSDEEVTQLPGVFHFAVS